MASPLRALIIEDSENDCGLLLSMLERGGYDVTHKRVCTPTALATVLDDGGWEIVISDYSMPRFKGTDALAMVRKKGLDVPFIFLSGTIGTIALGRRPGAYKWPRSMSNLRRGETIGQTEPRRAHPTRTSAATSSDAHSMKPE